MRNLLRAVMLLTVVAATPVMAGAGPGPRVLIQTSLGDITLQLDSQKAPRSVENFLNYVNKGFYNGTIFHRVIGNFMIQGGGFTEDYVKKPTDPPIPNEAANGLKNLRGTVAMARTSRPHSATAQFFINVVDNPFLDHTSPGPQGWGYAVFGKVISGMDVVDKILNVATGPAGPFRKDAPRIPVVIRKASVIADKATKP